MRYVGMPSVVATTCLTKSGAATTTGTKSYRKWSGRKSIIHHVPHGEDSVTVNGPATNYSLSVITEIFHFFRSLVSSYVS